MGDKSFYDLDYIIELNEKRLESYQANYQKTQEKLSTLMIFYSIIGFFLFPIIDLIINENSSIFFKIGFGFLILFVLVSIYYFIRFLMPVNVAYLNSPRVYYEDKRLEYEKIHKTNDKLIDTLLKSSYIDELHQALERNIELFENKGRLFFNALKFALISLIPFILCVGIKISQKEDKIQKIEIVNIRKSLTLDSIKASIMSNNNATTKPANSINQTPAPKLPHVDSAQIIRTAPKLIKENFSNTETKKSN